MAGVAGILAGALGLAALQTLVSTDRASSGFAALVTRPAAWAQAFMDPGKPLLPNLAKAACVEGGNVNALDLISTGTGAATVAPAAASPYAGAVPAAAYPTPAVQA